MDMFVKRISMKIPDFCMSHWLLRIPLIVVFAQQGLDKLPVDAETAASFDLPYLVWWVVAYGELGAAVGLFFGGLFLTDKLVHNMIAAPYLIHHGTEEQRQRWLPGVVSGETVLAIAMTEPDAGSDLQGMRTRAVKAGDEWVINGSKVFISNGQTADLVLVCAKTQLDSGEDKISIFLVESNAQGFKRGRNLDKIGRDAQDTSELFFGRRC